jgi:hypothetical protein
MRGVEKPQSQISHKHKSPAEMTSKEPRNDIGQIGINRRTAMKMTGAGLAGSVLFSGSAAAGGRWDASAIFVDSDFLGPGDDGNITTDGDGNELVLEGAVLFDKKDGADAMGGGPFSLEGPDVDDEDGTWTANEVVRFERYGAFPASVADFPQSWKGGVVELEVEFDPSIDGVEADDTLIIECAIGTNDSDEPEFGSGFFIGDYTEVEAAFNLFTYE